MTLMDVPASVANKRLMAMLSSLDATLTTNGGHVLQTKYFFSVLAPFACPCLPSSVRSSKFRIPQPLCLPLLRKLPGVYQQFPFWNSTCVLANPIPLSPILFQLRAWWYPVGSLMNRVYLDFNATTPVEPRVLDAMLPYFSAEFANAASIHTPGQKARAAVETAREQVAALVGGRPQEIVFTSGGTESDNHAIFGIVNPLVSGPFPSLDKNDDFPPHRHVLSQHKHVITTAIEQEAVLNTCQALEKDGVAVTYLSVDRDGRVDPGAVRRAIQTGRSAPNSISSNIPPATTLITIMHANNELGTIQPLEEIGRIAKEADVYFHADAVQSAGKIPI